MARDGRVTCPCRLRRAVPFPALWVLARCVRARTLPLPTGAAPCFPGCRAGRDEPIFRRKSAAAHAGTFRGDHLSPTQQRAAPAPNGAQRQPPPEAQALHPPGGGGAPRGGHRTVARRQGQGRPPTEPVGALRSGSGASRGAMRSFATKGRTRSGGYRFAGRLGKGARCGASDELRRPGSSSGAVFPWANRPPPGSPSGGPGQWRGRRLGGCGGLACVGAEVSRQRVVVSVAVGRGRGARQGLVMGSDQG